MKLSPISLTLLLALSHSAWSQIQPPAPVREPVPPQNPSGDNGTIDLPPPPAPGAIQNPVAPQPPVTSGAQPGTAGALTPLPVAPPAIPSTLDSLPLPDGNTGLLRNAALNDVFQLLATEAGKQFFHNPRLATPEYQVTGNLIDGDPLQQMEELAFQYNLTLHRRGNTVYALTSSQLSQLPTAEFHYRLNYLRPKDITQIQEMVRPLMTPGSGVITFETKTSTLIVLDTPTKIEQIRNFLRNIDRAKGQIVVETKIIRINSTAAERTGVNWSSSLGSAGTSLRVVRSLNSVFGLSSDFSENPLSEVENISAANNVVLSPLQLSGVLRALAEGGLAKQVSNPTLITEDNEPGSISIIDRVPIITTTINQSTASTQVTEDVRYKIDTNDKSIADEPEKHREVGISLTITPTLLPDGTVRMAMRPRSAQIVEQVVGQSGNRYPRVTESMIEATARVPDGHSLVVGGFYGEAESKANTKVPILGDIPGLNFFFKSKETTKEHTSLVFIVTPTSYNPEGTSQNAHRNNRVVDSVQFPPDHDWVDPNCNPGPAHHPNVTRAVRDLVPQQAPTYHLPQPAPAPVRAPAVKKQKPAFNPARK